MARIRTIKPDYWSSEQVMECSRDTRLMFLGIWNFADDKGRMSKSAKMILAKVFPGDRDLSEENILGMLDELESNGLIKTYIVDSAEFFYITGWHHQRIDKPQPAKYPPPPDNDPEAEQDHSENVLGTFDAIGKGKERKGKEKEGSRFALPDWVPEDLWWEWMEVRRKKKAVNSDRAKAALVNRLDEIRRAGIAVDRAIARAIERSWKGIEIEWVRDLCPAQQRPSLRALDL